MNLILTNHAKKRMYERKVKLEQIKETIELPNYVVAKSNKIEAYKEFNNKKLKVVYTKEDNFIKIITLIWK